MHALEHLYGYFKKTIDFGLYYLFINQRPLTAYADADWMRCIDIRRSTNK